MNGSENPRVARKGGGHGTGNDLLILPQVRQRSKRQSPIGDLSSPSAVSDSVGLVKFKCGTYWTPEMSACLHRTPGEHKRRHGTGEKRVSTEEVFSCGRRAQPSGKGGSHFVLGSVWCRTNPTTDWGGEAPRTWSWISHTPISAATSPPTAVLSVVLGCLRRALSPFLRAAWSSADAERAISPIADDRDPISVSTAKIVLMLCRITDALVMSVRL